MKTLRIVIADDDGVTLMVLRKILTSLGHTVVGEAGDGEQAVALVKEHNPDLCILDIRMPKMEGIAAAREIQIYRPTPIIIISAHTETGLGVEAAAVGAHAYLVKPFTENQIKPALELALTTFDKTQQLEGQLHKATEAVEHRKLIERAKGILMRQSHLDEEASYLRLQKAARDGNRKLVDVAKAVILADQMLRDTNNPDTPPPAGYTRKR